MSTVPPQMPLEEVAERLGKAKQELFKALKEIEELRKKSGVKGADLDELEGHLKEIKECMTPTPPIHHYLPAAPDNEK